MNSLTIEQLIKVGSIFEERSQDGILKRSANLIPSVFKWKGCSIFLYDKYEDVIRLARTSGLSSKTNDDIFYKRGEGLTGWVFEKQKPLLIRDLDKTDHQDLKKIDVDLKWKGKFSESDSQKAKSFMAVPMISSSGSLIGIIRTASDHKNFTQSDLEVFALIARYAAMAIENSQFIRKEKRKANYLELLMKIGTQMVSYFELDDLLSFVAENTAKTISAETCEIYLRKKEHKNTLILKGGYGIPSELINVAEHQVGEGLTGTIVKENRKIRSKNVLLLSEYKGKYRNAIKDHLKYGDRLTFLGMPIKIKNEVIGAIKLYNKILNQESGKYFTEEDEQYLQIITDMISVAIENVNYVDTMKLAAIKTMKNQRLTALGTLAMRIPNDVVNPVTEAQLTINNVLRKLKKAAIETNDNVIQKLTTIEHNLKKVANEVRVLQEFSTKTGFIHVKRTWKALLDESLMYLTNDLTSNKIDIKRNEKEESKIPEITVDPNEIIEILVTCISLVISRLQHYGSTLKIETRRQEANTLTTNIVGVDNKEGVKITRRSMSEMFGDTKSYSPYQFSHDVVKEIVNSNYHGNISFTESEDYTRLVLEIPITS